MPYNERIVTTEDRHDALKGAAVEVSLNDASSIAIDLHQLDAAKTLAEVLEWVVASSRRRSAQATLFIRKGTTLRPWRPKGDEAATRAGRRFTINVGGRTVAVVVAQADESTAAALDILTSYASRALESLTLHKALGLVPSRLPKMGSEVI